jgi:general secretion pathway protein I
VLVALAIVAVALAAASRAVAVSTDAAAGLKHRILAGFVAENRLTEVAARRAWPPLGTSRGSEQQAGVEFVWRTEVLATPHPLFRRVEVRVALAREPSHELRKLSAVLPREK